MAKTSEEKEEKRLKALARAIVEGTENNWRPRAMRVALTMIRQPPSRYPTSKRNVWKDWHSALKRPDPQFSKYETFNLFRYKSDEFLREILRQDREHAHDLEQMMNRAYLEVQLIEYILELRSKFQGVIFQRATK